jgi:hypothetical protein
LTSPSRIVDLSQGISVFPHEKNLLSQYVDRSPSWKSIHQLFQRWSDPDDSSLQHIKNMWFEFDLDSPADDLPLPGIFLRLAKVSTQEIVDAIQIALRDLLQNRASLMSSEALLSTIEAIPEGGYPTYIGVMLSRKQDGIRLNIRGLTPGQVWDYLDAIKWPHQIDAKHAIVDAALGLSQGFALTMDIHREVAPRIGFECIGGSPYHIDAGWQNFFRHLIENNLCTAQQSEALHQWVGFVTPNTSQIDWPIHLILAAIAQGSNWYDVIFRKLSHIKIVYDPSLPLEAKAYLEVRHQFLPYEFKGS